MEKYTIEHAKDFETDVDYTTVLENFEGPLDLLLYLIEKNKIEIKDVFVSSVTEQFLSYMKGLPYLDMEKASDYLNIAATIIDIKARSLIPPPDEWLDDVGFEDDYNPEQEFIQAIEEYKLIKEETEKLKERETVGYFFKDPDEGVGQPQIKYKDFTVDGLIDAFAKLMIRRETIKDEKAPAKKIQRDPFTVKQKIVHIREKIKAESKVIFEDLFTSDASRAEIVTTFQALLELLKHQILMVSQNEIFSTIIIEENPNWNEEAEIGEIDEYN